MGLWSSKEQTIGTEPRYLKWYGLLLSFSFGFFFFFHFQSPLYNGSYPNWRLGERYMTGGGRGRAVYIVPSFVYSPCARVAARSGQRCVETGGPDRAGLCKWGCKLASLPLFVRIFVRG